MSRRFVFQRTRRLLLRILAFFPLKDIHFGSEKNLFIPTVNDTHTIHFRQERLREANTCEGKYKLKELTDS